MELVSAAREYESREEDPTLGGFVDRLSLLSEADEAEGAKEARVWLMSMHAAKGLEFPIVIVAGMEGRPVSALALGGRRGRSRRRAPPLLRLPDARRASGSSSRRRTTPHLRRLSADRAVAIPGEIPDHLVDRIEPAPPRWQHQATSCATRTRAATAEDVQGGFSRKFYAYEYEDQSTPGVRAGMRVRHKQFGVGTVVQVEDQGDDLKDDGAVPGGGTKKLLARYAGLEPA
jgi:DNA helicase-2/ATP-dependent DNA helicase PcrA